METAKEYLSKLERLDELIREKKLQLDDLKLMASSFGSRSYEEQVQTSKKGDTFENKILQCVALEQEIESDIIDYLLLKQKIIREIGSLEETKYVKLLNKRYVEQKRLKVIAKEMHYEHGSIRILHCEALDAFQTKILNKQRDNTN